MCAAAAEQPVAFSATYMTADHHGLGVGQTLKFDKVIYNAGNAYNPATGLFIAPTDGTYLFYGHVGICSPPLEHTSSMAM